MIKHRPDSIKELNDKGLKTQQLALDTAMWDTAMEIGRAHV